jgi:hypothetical protein
MSEHSDIIIKAEWFASDLRDYRSDFPISLLSSHRQVVNMLVDGWRHLLAISSPSLYKGPAAIGLSLEDLNSYKRLLNDCSEVWFSPGIIKVCGQESNLIINWTDSPCVSFAPPVSPCVDLIGNSPSASGRIHRSLQGLRQHLSEISGVSSSAVLLGMEGGEEYFRMEIVESFPSLVNSALTGNQEEFRSYCLRLVGLGHGSTPTGDDLIHGALIACRYYFHYQRVSWEPPGFPKQICRSTTLMGAHVLEMAQRGLTPEPVRNLLQEIFSGCLSRKSCNDLLSMGSSTGYDLGVAVYCTLSHLVS